MLPGLAPLRLAHLSTSAAAPLCRALAAVACGGSTLASGLARGGAVCTSLPQPPPASGAVSSASRGLTSVAASIESAGGRSLQAALQEHGQWRPLGASMPHSFALLTVADAPHPFATKAKGKPASSKASAAGGKAKAKKTASKPAPKKKAAPKAKPAKKPAKKKPASRSPLAEVGRAPSAYNLFIKDKFAKTVPVNAEGKPDARKAIALLAQQFKELGEEERKHYEDESKRLKAEVAELRAKIKAKIRATTALTPYLHFVIDARDRVKAENPELSSVELVRTLASQWRALTDEAKAPFVERSKAERAAKGLPEPKGKKK